MFENYHWNLTCFWQQHKRKCFDWKTWVLEVCNSKIPNADSQIQTKTKENDDTQNSNRKKCVSSHYPFNLLREEILARRNFGEWAHSPILVQFGGMYFGDLMKFLNLARINFGERPIFGEHFSGNRMKKEIFRRINQLRWKVSPNE